jgi:putative transposase
MAAQALTAVVLAPEEEVLLRQLVLVRTTPAAVVTRARVLLSRHEGATLQGCAVEAACSRSTACRTCARFRWDRLEALWEKRRPGTPKRYPAELRELVCALVRQAPDQAGLPVTRWSLQWLRIAVRQAGISPAPSRETLRRWLHSARLPWHRHRSWQTSNDPHFWEKLQRLRELYENTDPELLVLAFDEKPQIQALGKRLPDRFPIPGHPRLRQHDYLRHGTFTLCCIQRLHDGKVTTASCPRHTARVTAAFLARYLRRRPEPRVAIILDNLSTHTCAHFRKALIAAGKQVELAFTPHYASWANSAEWFLNHLQRDLLDLAVVASVAELVALTKRYRILYNRHRAKHVTMPGLGRFLGRVSTSKTGH